METAVNSGMCRCCASEGAFKDVKSTYHWMGEEEIYADMLRECFDIDLHVSEHGEDGGICEVCITQLRNAINFKKQVLHTEEQFKNHLLNKTMFRPNIVKVEVQHDEESDDNNADSGDDGFTPEYEIPIKTEVPEDPKPKKRAAKASMTTRSKKTKTDAGETSIKRGEKKSDEKSEESEGEIDNTDFQTEELKTASRTELVEHRKCIKEILTHSNATAIRRYGGIGYTCCFCKDQYEKPADLKNHTIYKHHNINEANFMKSMNMSQYVVKLDITGLKCKLCNTDVASLNVFIDHLYNDHEIKISKDHTNHIFPFKFDNDVLQCVICSNYYSKFRVLANHMHVHFKNFVCSICSSGFVNRNALTQHSVNHKNGDFACEFCSKTFPTLVKKRTHERSAHTHVEVVNKCGYCKETFKDYRKKEAHLVEAHGIASVKPVCQACNKTFTTRKLLNTHIKRDHLMERLHKCTHCEMTFYSSTGLKSHMVKHTGSKEFKCTICSKAFGRKKTLNAHMRIHEQKRYKCKICKHEFVQKCTWKSHMRTKHDEIV